MANINELLDGHVTLELECLDRLYLNGYVGTLATSGQYMFLSEWLGKPVPSPVLLAQIPQRFVEELKSYAEQNEIPVIQFQHGERKDDAFTVWQGQNETNKRSSGRTTVPRELW